MIVVPFEEWHWEFITPAWPVWREGVNFERDACAVTLTEAGKLYAVFGCVPVWPGVVETFFIPSKDFDKKKVAGIKLVKQNEEIMKRALNVHREQTTCPVTNKVAKRWLEFLGYSQEGIMKEYGPNREDHYRFARVA